MRRCAEALTAAILGLGLSFAPPTHADGVPRLDQAAALRASQAAIGTTPADFTFLDRQGRPVRLADYRGKPLLVSFIYTGCFTICPTQTRTLHAAVRGLDRMLGPDHFNVLSIGFNQPFDTPQALRAFAAQNGIDYPNWEFVSPQAGDVEALTRAFGFSWVETPAGFDHIVGVTALDGEGRIYSQVYNDRLTTEALGVLLRQLVLGAPPSGTTFSLGEIVERVRILCTVYDPETGEYRYKWGLIFELLGGLAFFTPVAVYLWRERQEQRRARHGTAAAPVANPVHSA